MPDQAYSDLVARAADSDWINRVKGALEQVALTKIQNTPVDATAIAEDAGGLKAGIPSPVWKVQAGFRSRTLSRLIWVRAE